jgi:hypothetical protein
MKVYGETHCPYCERPLSTDEDYDKYKAQSQEGSHICWNYPSWECVDSKEEPILAEDKLIEVLHRRDELEGMLEEALAVAEGKV